MCPAGYQYSIGIVCGPAAASLWLFWALSRPQLSGVIPVSFVIQNGPDKSLVSPLWRRDGRCGSKNWALFLMKITKLQPPPSKWTFGHFNSRLPFALDQTIHVGLSACTWGLGPPLGAQVTVEASGSAFGQVLGLASGPVQVQGRSRGKFLPWGGELCGPQPGFIRV